AHFLAEWLERFASAMRILYSPTRLSLAVLLTCLGWGTLALSSVLLIQAFQVPAPPAAALLVLVATNLGAVVPSSPGSLGVYHVMAVMALSGWQGATPGAGGVAVATPPPPPLPPNIPRPLLAFAHGGGRRRPC